MGKRKQNRVEVSAKAPDLVDSKNQRKQLEKKAQDQLAKKRGEDREIKSLDPLLMQSIYGPDWKNVLKSGDSFSDQLVTDFDVDVPPWDPEVGG